MTVNYTTNLALGQPVTGTESGTWGDDVNNSVTSYLDIAIAGTVTLTNDGAVTLSNTQGTSSATNIVSSLTGAGSVSAQFAIIRVTGALTVAKVLTAPSSSKTFVVVNAATGSTVTIKASGQSGVSVAVGETATVYYNGTDYIKSATTLSGSGTVTSASVVSANGFTGTVATATTTPAITLTTSITGVLKGNGTAISAATAGTDYVAPGTATTFTATQTFNGSSSTFASVLLNTAETATVSATAATGTINYYINSQSVLYYTTNASANWTLNVAFSSGTSLNTAMATGQTVTLAFLVTQGSTAYYASAFTIDGTSVTPKWQGGTAPTAGNASSVDVYTYTITKTASATYTVLASQTKFA